MHKCVSKLTIISSDNGLSPGRRQAIIWTNAVKLLIGPLETNFNEIYFKMSSGKWKPYCPGIAELKQGPGVYVGVPQCVWCGLYIYIAIAPNNDIQYKGLAPVNVYYGYESQGAALHTD